MKRRIALAFAILVASVSVSLAHSIPAQAIVTGCTTSVTSGVYASVRCTGSTTLFGQARALAYCVGSYWVNGRWVYPGTTSTAYCPYGIQYNSYETRY